MEESETLLLRRKFFYSDQNVDSRDPVQLNLLYVQVNVPVRKKKNETQKSLLCSSHCVVLIYGLACNYEGVQSEAEGSVRGFNDRADNSQDVAETAGAVLVQTVQRCSQ